MVTSPEDPNVAQASYPQSGFPDIPGSADILLIRHGQSEPYRPGTPFLGTGEAEQGPTAAAIANAIADAAGVRLRNTPSEIVQKFRTPDRLNI